MRSVFFIFVNVIVILVQCPTKAQEEEAIINLRIEGDENTIFEGSLLTKGKSVTTVSGGTHKCDGTNNNASSISGPTVTSSLDLAAYANGFSWDGTYYQLYDDYSITRIGNTSQTSSKFWNALVDYKFSQVGGCQEKVKQDEDLLFAFDAYNKAHVLKLEISQKSIQIGSPLTVTVTDGLTGQPIDGAIVAGVTTNTLGRATITFNNFGVQRLKAERYDSIRSNGITVTITA